MDGLLDNSVVKILIHWVLPLLTALIVVTITGIIYHRTTITPSQKNGSKQKEEYTIPRTGTLYDYLASKGQTMTSIPMRSLSVATACFGGIHTEDIGVLTPYIGTVSPDAARLQVMAGARAIVFDIWPDPADPATPVVCAMKEDSAFGPSSVIGTSAWWLAHGGLDRGTGRYSNWKMLTRNKVRAGTILSAAVTAATNSSTNAQWMDPFFLILCLHGAMTTDYLNTLAADLSAALKVNDSGKGMSPTARSDQPNALCNATPDDFKEKVCVIVCPDIQPGFQSLPNVNTFQQFALQYKQTNMMNYTNILQAQPNTILYTPESVSTLTQDTAMPCDGSGGSGAMIPPPQAGFCVVRPSTGGTSSENGVLYGGDANYVTALRTGAQFVAINLFSNESDGKTLSTFFDPSYFGTYSFRLNQ